MLILTRRFEQKIVIGGEVTVTVLGVRGGQVRLGIDAPRKIAVDREEIYRSKNGRMREAGAEITVEGCAP